MLKGFGLHAQQTLPPLENEPPPEAKRLLRFDYGMNLGFYRANAGTANYYNGTGEHSLESIINQTYNYNRIRQDIGYDFKLANNGLPLQMSYKPAVMLGFFGSLHFNPKVGGCMPNSTMPDSKQKIGLPWKLNGWFLCRATTLNFTTSGAPRSGSTCDSAFNIPLFPNSPISTHSWKQA